MSGDSCKDPEQVETDDSTDLAERFIQLEREFVARLAPLFPGGKLKSKKKDDNVEYVYNPLEYAADLHNQYLKKYCNSPKKLVFLGMNPGPWGMCQTGVRIRTTRLARINTKERKPLHVLLFSAQVPFGEVNAVKEYLRISGEVQEPKSCHPKRKIEGLNCKRSEVSGKRLWGLIANLSKDDPTVFFKDCFVYNYCPLAFLSNSAKNVTPADLKVQNDCL